MTPVNITFVINELFILNKIFLITRVQIVHVIVLQREAELRW